jgi:diguanylate cyclase
MGHAGVVEDRLAAAWRQRRSDPAATLAVAEQLRDEALAAGDDVARGRALTISGACHLLRSDLVAALRALLEALAALEAAPAADRARALSEAGFVDVMTGEHDRAVERLTEALRLYEAAGDPGGCADTLNRIGVAFYDHGDLDDAEAAYHRALELRREVADEVAVAGLHNNLAKVRTARGDLDGAADHLAEARARFEAAGETRGVGMVLHNLAVVELDRGRTRVAVELLERSVELYETVGYVQGACEARTRLGVALTAGGRREAAWPHLLQAHEDALRIGSLAERARAAERLSDLAERQDEPAVALAWMRRLREVERALFDERSEARFRGLQVRFQLERLERDSVTDALTGLRNRRGLDRALADLATAHQGDRALAVLLLDLDDFKRVNDVFSHSTGDEVLRAVGQLLRASTRPTDVCARYGGEEFVVLLPGCDQTAAQQVAGTLVRRIREHPWTTLAPGLAVTSSLGLATLAEVDAPELLLGAADRALYAAKHDGKDRVVSVTDRR